MPKLSTSSPVTLRRTSALAARPHAAALALKFLDGPTAHATRRSCHLEPAPEVEPSEPSGLRGLAKDRLDDRRASSALGPALFRHELADHPLSAGEAGRDPRSLFFGTGSRGPHHGLGRSCKSGDSDAAPPRPGRKVPGRPPRPARRRPPRAAAEESPVLWQLVD